MSHFIRRAWVPVHSCWLLALPAISWAQEAEPPIRQLGVVVVTAARASSLPSQIPTTVESIDAEQIEATINATDSEDALKYFPSLLVRKRYIGDYNHAVLSTRASGTGNSARSMVYADGILLSNLLGNGASFAPRWGLVTPEEIERVDVLYGPVLGRLPGQLGGRGGRVPDAHAHAVRGARQGRCFHAALRALQHPGHLLGLAGQRLAGQPPRAACRGG